MAPHAHCILARHRLPRHPGGLEGSPAIEVNVHVDDLPLAEPDDLRVLELCERPAGRAGSSLSGQHDHLLAAVDYLVYLLLPLIEGKRAEPVLEERPESIKAPVDPEPRDSCGRHVPDDLGSL